jgi:hypothetical protein
MADRGRQGFSQLDIAVAREIGERLAFAVTARQLDFPVGTQVVWRQIPYERNSPLTLGIRCSKQRQPRPLRVRLCLSALTPLRPPFKDLEAKATEAARIGRPTRSQGGK